MAQPGRLGYPKQEDMSRGRKLLIVGLVLMVGLGLAWPFRLTNSSRSTAERDFGLVAVAKRPATERSRAKRTTAQQPSRRPAHFGLPAPNVVAKMTSMQDARIAENAAATSFDLANHPALVASLPPRRASPVTPPLPPEIKSSSSPSDTISVQQPEFRGRSRPTYATSDGERAWYADEQPDSEVRHVVQNSDTLEKLAKRYLGDEGRALEIFDLNRDVLDNPHLLPIDAQLRIPVRIAGQ